MVLTPAPFPTLRVENVLKHVSWAVAAHIAALFFIPRYCDDKYSLGNKLRDLLMTCHPSFGVTIILIVMIRLSRQSRMPFISGSEECNLS